MSQKVGMIFVLPLKKSTKKANKLSRALFIFKWKKENTVNGGFMRKINFDIFFFEVHLNSESKGESDQNKDWCVM